MFILILYRRHSRKRREKGGNRKLSLEGRSSCLFLDVQVPFLTLSDVDVDDEVAELGSQLESVDVRNFCGQSKGGLHFCHEMLWTKAFKSGQGIAGMGVASSFSPYRPELFIFSVRPYFRIPPEKFQESFVRNQAVPPSFMFKKSFK